jgi:hypothetical protein
MKETIKSFVDECLREGGMTTEQIWRAEESKFPHQLVNYSYIANIVRKNTRASCSVSNGDRT